MALPSTPSMVASVLLSSNSCTIGHLLKSNGQYQIQSQFDKKDSRMNFNMASTVQDVCCGPGPCLLEIQKNIVSCSLSSEKQEKRRVLCLRSLSATSHRNPSRHVISGKISQCASQYRWLGKCSSNRSTYIVADKVQLRFTIFLDLMFLNLGICIQLATFLPTQWSWSWSRQQTPRSSQGHHSPSTSPPSSETVRQWRTRHRP